MAVVPHYAFPLTLGTDGMPVVVEQDTLDDVAQCVTVLLLTTKGRRLDLPSYGISDPTFRPALDSHDVMAAVALYEPRAQVALSSSADVLTEAVQVRVARAS